jgi:DNA-binding MarR family transcriptional regulator
MMQKKIRDDAELRVLTRTISAAFTLTKFNALRHPLWLLMLVVVERERAGLETCVNDLMQIMRKSQSCVSRAVAAACDEGLTETIPSVVDKRRTCVRLTKLGHSLIGKVLAAMRAASAAERWI